MIHSGLGGGAILFKKSKNLVFVDNVIFDHTNMGASFVSASNVVFDRNLVAQIVAQSESVYTPWAGVATCTAGGATSCSNFKMRDNIVAGATWAGFSAQMHRCGQKNFQNFRGNVAHGINFLDGRGGHGVYYYPGGGCSEASLFIAYKCAKSGITGGFKSSRRVDFSNLLSIDNANAFEFGFSEAGQNSVMSINDNTVWGSSVVPDCP